MTPTLTWNVVNCQKKAPLFWERGRLRCTSGPHGEVSCGFTHLRTARHLTINEDYCPRTEEFFDFAEPGSCWKGRIAQEGREADGPSMGPPVRSFSSNTRQSDKFRAVPHQMVISSRAICR